MTWTQTREECKSVGHLRGKCNLRVSEEYIHLTHRLTISVESGPVLHFIDTPNYFNNLIINKMKQLLFTLLILVCVSSCKQDEQLVMQKATTLVDALNKKDGDAIKQLCPSVEIFESLYKGYSINDVIIEAASKENCYKVNLSTDAYFIAEISGDSATICELSYELSNEDKVKKLVIDYLSCEKWQDRIQYVVPENDIKKVMGDFYANWDSSKKEYPFPDDVDIMGEVGTSQIAIVARCKKDVFYIVNTSEGYRINWKASVGMNDTTLSEIKSNNLKDVENVRVTTYFFDNEQYSDAITVEISNLSDYEVYTVYMFKNNKKYNELLHLLSKKSKQNILITINEYNSRNKMFEISDFKEGWFD